MRRALIVFLILILLFLYGCTFQPPFRQSTENIVQIELVDNSIAEDTILCTFTDTEIVQFMEGLQKIECHKRLQPVGDFSALEIRIHYADGSVDIIGSGANGYIEAGELHISGWYYYKEDALRDLFAAYIE